MNKSMNSTAPWVLLALITFLAFANAWPDALVLDDKAFVGPLRVPELNSLAFMFSQDLWAGPGGYSGLYRPLLLVDFYLESTAFGDWSRGYHLSNIVRHLLVTMLLFGFLRWLLRKTVGSSKPTEFYALLAALVFAVHPIHTEVVNSVFNRSEIMAALVGLGGIWCLLYFIDTRPARAWLGLAAAYSIGMLYRETVVVLPGIAVMLVLFLDGGDLASRIRKCLPVFWLLIPLAIYFAMRTYALNRPELRDAAMLVDGSEFSSELEMLKVPDSQKLLDVAGVIGQSLKIMAWPYPLQLFHSRPSITVSIVYLVLQLALFGFGLSLLKKNRPGLAIGLSFFYLAMLPSSRLIGGWESAPHIAERYLYFPSLGLTLTLAFAFMALSQRYGRRILLLLGMPVLVAFSVLTWDRNSDWSSEVRLFETEYQRGERGGTALRLLTGAQLKAGNQERVVRICDANIEIQEEHGSSAYVRNCAVAYEFADRDEDVVRTHMLAIQEPSTRVTASVSLASYQLRKGREKEAEDLFQSALDWTDDPAEKAFLQAELLISYHPANREQALEAKAFLEEALRLRPDWPEARLLLDRLNLKLQSESPKTNDA